MYEGNNPIALASREWLINALLSLMEHKPYSKITIQDICTAADLSRQTFYNFFETKDDIIRFCLHRCYTEMMKKTAPKSPLLLSDIIRQLTETFQQNQRLMNLVISHNLEHFLEVELVSSILSFAEQISPESNPQWNRYSISFLTGAIAHTIICWASDSNPLSFEELNKLLCKILSGNYYQIIF